MAVKPRDPHINSHDLKLCMFTLFPRVPSLKTNPCFKHDNVNFLNTPEVCKLNIITSTVRIQAEKGKEDTKLK